MRVQSAWVADLDFVTQKIDEMERLALNGEAHVALELLYDMVPTFRPVDSEASIQLRRRRANVEAVRNFHIVSQSI